MTRENSPKLPGIASSDESRISDLAIYQSYARARYLSLKHSSYFHVYTDLLERYRNKDTTFVEIGVQNGGSLFMWRDYLGPRARIIGVDFNPRAKMLENDGFEIYIGSQADPKFWQSFFAAVRNIDVVLDDGGHTFEQQIFTVHSCIPYINEGGLMIVEDTHTSYYEEFGYPTQYSFIEWTKLLIDNINSRAPRVNASDLPYKNTIYSIAIFESIVCFRIYRSRCYQSSAISNGGISAEAEDYRYSGSSMAAIHKTITKIADRFPLLRRIALVRWLKKLALSSLAAYLTRRRLKRLGNFF